MIVQLGVLAMLNHWATCHYLYASAAAVEVTLLHNFMWHMRYTWRDRKHQSDRLRQLIRFHLSNGLVSMLGNLALMRILVDKARLPVLAANCVAILCCSLVNFGLGDAWVFAAMQKRVQEQEAIPSSRKMAPGTGASHNAV